jgi:manganese transport protein
MNVNTTPKQIAVTPPVASVNAQPLQSFRKWLSSLGPGIIIAAVIFGPSKMTITSKMGAQYGYSLLWVVAVAIFFLVIFTNMAARIGMATNQSLLTSIRMKWGNAAAIAVGLGVFFVTTSFQAGNSIGVGISVAEANGTSPVIWVIVFNLIGISLLFFRRFYKVLEKLMIFLVAMMLFAFLTTLFFVQPDLVKTATGFIPSMVPASLGLVIAFFASCFSIVGAFYQSYLVQERRKINPEISSNHNSVTGIIILGVMSVIVMICAAAVLNRQGLPVTSASDMAKALEPLFGTYASTLFLVGLFGASFSSLVGNASIGGTLLGAAIAIIFGKLPLELIVFAQSVTIFLVPFIGIAMFAISNDEKIMGKHKNSMTVKVFATLGLLILVGLAISNVKELFLK